LKPDVHRFDSYSWHVTYDEVDAEDTYKLVRHLALMSGNDRARYNIKKMYDHMNDVNETPKVIITALLSAALDGLRHNN
jgi:hypothetical protein